MFVRDKNETTNTAKRRGRQAAVPRFIREGTEYHLKELGNDGLLKTGPHQTMRFSSVW